MTESEMVLFFFHRTIAEQFINACDESRHNRSDHSVQNSRSGHEGFESNSSGSHINKY